MMATYTLEEILEMTEKELLRQLRAYYDHHTQPCHCQLCLDFRSFRRMLEKPIDQLAIRAGR